jgi:hypothetical protein
MGRSRKMCLDRVLDDPKESLWPVCGPDLHLVEQLDHQTWFRVWGLGFRV